MIDKCFSMAIHAIESIVVCLKKIGWFVCVFFFVLKPSIQKHLQQFFVVDKRNQSIDNRKQTIKIYPTEMLNKTTFLIIQLLID